MSPARESSCCLHEELVLPLQSVTHIRDDEEVPNLKRMRVVEEEVSLSQPISVVVPQEEEDVPVP
jgi:hypothetical protein